MKTRFVVPTLLLAGMAAFGNAAMASDELAGVLIGAGSGAAIGHAINGRNGAVVGGFLGAMVGAAVADNDGRRAVVYAPPRPVYGPPAVVVYDAPYVRYAPMPVYVEARPAPCAWRHEWQERHEGRWDRRHDRWDDDHDGRHGW